MWQSNDYLSADSVIAPTDRHKKNFEEHETITGFLEFVDYSPLSWPYLLIWKHNKYFTVINPEEKARFSVLYYDQYDTLPSTGYPKVSFWLEGSSNQVSLELDAAGWKIPQGCTTGKSQWSRAYISTGIRQRMTPARKNIRSRQAHCGN